MLLSTQTNLLINSPKARKKRKKEPKGDRQELIVFHDRSKAIEGGSVSERKGKDPHTGSIVK